MKYNTNKIKYKYAVYCPFCGKLIFKIRNIEQEIGLFCPKCSKWIEKIPLNNFREITKIKY